MSFSEFKTVIEEKDTVILYIGISHIYSIEVLPKIKNKSGVLVDNVFQTHYGALRVIDLVGVKFGSKVQLTKGYGYVLYPTPELWTVTLPHRTQILYTPDISMVILQLDIRSGSVVTEAGTGSGSVSHAILRAIGPAGYLYTYDFHKERVDTVRDEFKCHGFGNRMEVIHRDVCLMGFLNLSLSDAIFLDLPKPWLTIQFAIKALKESGGRICSFSPCIEQVGRTCEVMTKLGLKEVTTLECLSREFQIRNIALPVIKVNSQNTRSEEYLQQKKKLKTNNVVSNEESRSETSIPHLDEASHKSEPTLVQFKTGVPRLKMPGHTGYLTFATLPPKIFHNVKAE